MQFEDSSQMLAPTFCTPAQSCFNSAQFELQLTTLHWSKKPTPFQFRLRHPWKPSPYISKQLQFEGFAKKIKTKLSQNVFGHKRSDIWHHPRWIRFFMRPPIVFSKLLDKDSPELANTSLAECIVFNNQHGLTKPCLKETKFQTPLCSETSFFFALDFVSFFFSFFFSFPLFHLRLNLLPQLEKVPETGFWESLARPVNLCSNAKKNLRK
jgi:hypothetical protein